MCVCLCGPGFLTRVPALGILPLRPTPGGKGSRLDVPMSLNPPSFILSKLLSQIKDGP